MNPKGFYFDTMLVCDFVVPPERDFLRAFNGILRYATPQIMAQTWIDAEWLAGAEQERREFNLGCVSCRPARIRRSPATASTGISWSGPSSARGPRFSICSTRRPGRWTSP